MADLLTLALMAMEDKDALPVLADAVLEAQWFDARVMQIMWPLTKSPRGGWTTKKKRDRAKIDREAHKTGYPLMFLGLAAKPSRNWAKAIAAVLLFAPWQKRMWRVVLASKTKLQFYSNAQVFLNGQPLEEITHVRIGPAVQTIAQRYSR